MFQSLSEISTIFNNDVSFPQNMIQKLKKNKNNHFRQEFRCKYLIQTCHSKCIFQSIWFVFPDVMLGWKHVSDRKYCSVLFVHLTELIFFFWKYVFYSRIFGFTPQILNIKYSPYSIADFSDIWGENFYLTTVVYLELNLFTKS